MNYYPFNLGDYAAHTGHLEPMEDLAYRRLLDVYYMREGPLPADVNATAKLIRLRSCIADVESVLHEFFTLTDEGWRHGRCDEEIAKMREKQGKARASAAASVNARRAKAELGSSTTVERTLPPDPANVERTLPKAPTDVQLPIPIPIPKKNTPIPPKGGKGRFEEFWLAWPKHERKQDKKTCGERWAKEGLDDVADQILADVRAKRGTKKWQEGFVEAPLVYLNRRRWEDENTDVEPAGEFIV